MLNWARTGFFTQILSAADQAMGSEVSGGTAGVEEGSPESNLRALRILLLQLYRCQGQQVLTFRKIFR